MGDLFEYLSWRGDLSFGNAPLCPPDALLFSLLTYIDLTEVVPAAPGAEPVRLADAVKRYFSLPGAEQRIANPNHIRLLHETAASTRYGSLRLFAARREVNPQKGIQFGALSVLLPGQQLFSAFEGTDDTLVGWKEDFRMSYECPVPAQLLAAQYLRTVAAAYPLRRIMTGGHSKGGNLAMFAAVHAGDENRDRIRAVYNNDGPGFCDGTICSPEYREIRDRIHTYMPQSSIVAVLLEHDCKYRMVKSNRSGIMQHDGYSWQIKGADFEYTNERTAFGQQTEAMVDRFVASLSPERKRHFCEALFELLEASEQETVSGIGNNKKKSLTKIFRAYTGLPEDMRKVLSETVATLNRSRKAARKASNDRALGELLTAEKGRESS